MLSMLPQHRMFALSIHPGAVLSILSFGLLIAFVFWAWSRRSEDPPLVLALKIGLSTALLLGAGYCILAFHPIIGVPLAAVCGILTGVLWARNIGAALAKPLTGLYDGGDEEPELVPFYAIAQAHRKQARFAEAIAEIRKQLERFPGEVQGLLLLAEIQGKDLGDWEAARASVEEIVAQESLPVAPRARALQALADWHLDSGNDIPGARALLERIEQLFPGTPEARDARQRMDHLGDAEWRKERAAPSTLRVKVNDRRLGLEASGTCEPPPQESAEDRVARLVRWLAEHPADTEAREQLAMAYAEADGSADRAVAQLEWLIAQPHPTPRQLETWHHKIADLRILYGADEAGAREALSRLVTSLSGTALAARAQTRIEHLKLEVKGRGQASRIRMEDSGGDVRGNP